jgi:transcriptional regulator with XRE-family HTH domain
MSIGDAPILDGQAIRRHRLAAGLSRRQVAPLLNLSQTAIRNLERGVNHDELTIRHVRRLAHVLGVGVSELLAQPPERAIAPEADAAVVGAALSRRTDSIHRDQLAFGLGWTLERTQTALERAQTNLDSCGLRLRIEGRGNCWLASGMDWLQPPQVSRLDEDCGPFAELNRQELALLHLIRSNPIDAERKLRVRDRQRLGRLMEQGLVEVGRDGLLMAATP